MPRGWFDYGVNPSGQITAPEISTSEMVARLGAAPIFDRQGEILFYDQFADGLNRWTITAVGTGSSGTLSVARSLSGGYSLKVAAGPNVDNNVICAH